MSAASSDARPERLADEAQWHPVSGAVADSVIGALSFDENGLIPAIAQDASTGSVLMMAWMNDAAVRETLTTGRVCYWSRSRKALWRKGETSGHVQRLRGFCFDCDGDTLLLQVDQTGPACHTNRPNCFYQDVRPDGVTILTDPIS